MNKTLSSALVAMMFCVTGAKADTGTMIVLDASGSMWGQVDGINKIVIARDVVRENLAGLTANRSLGLIAYGHRRKGDCGDIEVLLTPQPGSSDQVSAVVDAINPKGKTPLSEAVRLAAQTLRYREDPSTVVLVTDGLETCGADPCALARELEQSGADFTAHVVGFGVSRQDGAAVSCLARETGGKYIKADNKEELARALEQTIAGADPAAVPQDEPAKVEPRHTLQINVQLSPDSPPLENGEIDKLTLDLFSPTGERAGNIGYSPVMAVKIDPGEYILRATYAGGFAENPIVIDPYDVTHATMSLDAGVIRFKTAAIAPDLIDDRDISWIVTNLDTGKQHARYSPQLDSVFAAGQYEVTPVLRRKTKISPPAVQVTVTAGDVSEGQIVMPHGALRIETVSDSGEPLPHSFVRFALSQQKPNGTGQQNVIGANDSKKALLALPGEYTLTIEDWGIAKGGKRKLTRPITVAPGSSTKLRIQMPADPQAGMREISQ